MSGPKWWRLFCLNRNTSIPIKNLILFLKPAFWLAFITILCLMPAEDLPRVKAFEFPHFDKVVHFGMYFIFALLMVRPLKINRWPVWPVTILSSMFVGGVIEILQFAFTYQRFASWGDFAADMTGALAGLVAYVFLVKDKPWERFV